MVADRSSLLRLQCLVMTSSQVDAFFSDFVQAIGYGVTWQVPLYVAANLVSDAAEAAYVSAKPPVQTIEIGNEPNLYPNVETEYQTYLNQSTAWLVPRASSASRW